MSGHTKVYGICENKCMVETMSKGQIENELETIKPKYLRFIDSVTYEVEMKEGLMIYANSNVGDSVIKFKNNTTEPLYLIIDEPYDRYAVKKINPNSSYSETVYYSDLFSKFYHIVKGETITIESEE